MMKKLTVILITGLFFLLILSGCSQKEPIVSVSAEDPLLAELPEAFEAADLNHARIDADHAAYSDLESVRVTRELLQEIGDALLAGNPEPLDPPLRSVSGSGKSIVLQFPFGDEQHAIIEMFGDAEEKPDRTVMWLQLGEDYAQYTLESSAFDKIYELVAANTYPKELLLEGDHVRYVPEGIASDEVYFSLKDVLEVDGVLLFLWGRQNDYRLDTVNPQTGKAESVWEYTAPQEFDWMPLKLERADYAGFDYRILGQGMAVYRSSQDPSVSKVFEAPKEILQSGRFSYDVYPKKGLIAYSADDGVYVGTENKMIRILNHKNALPPSKPGETGQPEEFDPYYGEVRLLNEGRHLAAAVIYPGSQSGLHALVLVEIETGKATLYEDLFSAMIAEVSYPDDRTIAASALDMEWVTMIDAVSGQSTRLPFEAYANTHDFKTWVNLQQGRGGDGVPSGFVTAYRADAPDSTRQLLKVTGENAYIAKVTSNYTILICRDSREAFAAIIPL